MSNRDEYAIALPNTVDNSFRLSQKWRKAIYNEAFFTQKLRNLRFLTHPFYKVIIVKINGESFPIVIMKKYDQYDFKLSDSKNSHSSTQKEVLPDKISVELISNLLKNCCQDFSSLIKNKIHLGNKDSINLAFTESGLRLFLNDLGDCKQEKIIQMEDVDFYCYVYTDWLISAFVQSLDNKSYEIFNSFFEYKSLVSKDLKQKLVNKIKEFLIN